MNKWTNILTTNLVTLQHASGLKFRFVVARNLIGGSKWKMRLLSRINRLLAEHRL